MSDYPNDSLFAGSGGSVWDEYRRLQEEEWEEHVRLTRAGQLPIPAPSTGLCRACGADAALPGGLLCSNCRLEVFAEDDAA